MAIGDGFGSKNLYFYKTTAKRRNVRLERPASKIKYVNCFNIAEGTGGESDKEMIRYLYLAKKSLFETITGLKLIQRIYHFDSSSILGDYGQLGKSLQALISSLTKD